MVENTGFFKDKVVFMSGGSRGIGLAIAKKLAKDGARIVIAAKTDTPHPKLPGTIYTAAEEIRQAGGECLPCVVDVRDEKAVDNAVRQAVEKFGGIDIVINNASAISLTDTSATDMKRFDLMHHINTRGTFLLSKKCLPYLRKSTNPHILNISPPLLMESQWFAPHVAYTMAKYGMSMCALGMSEEFKPDKIAVNCLWPRTSVYTAATRVSHGGGSIPDLQKHCRKDSIMADSAYIILSKASNKFTGQFVIDDEILIEHGVTDLDQYAFDKNAKLASDFFVPGVKYLGPNSRL